MFALSTSNRRNLHFLKNVQAQDLGSQIVPQLKATIASHNIKEVRVLVITNLYTVSRATLDQHTTRFHQPCRFVYRPQMGAEDTPNNNYAREICMMGASRVSRS